MCLVEEWLSAELHTTKVTHPEIVLKKKEILQVPWDTVLVFVNCIYKLIVSFIWILYMEMKQMC